MLATIRVPLVCLVGVHDGELDKEEGKHGKDERLHEADEHFKGHQWGREEVGEEEARYKDHHLAGKDVAEKAEGEGDQATYVTHELDKPYDKPHRPTVEVNVARHMAEEAKRGDTRYLYHKERDHG